MLDQVMQHTPHTLSDEDRRAYRGLLLKTHADMQWANHLQRALDDADHWRAEAQKTDCDSELAGEVELLREQVEVQRKRADALQYELEQVRASRESLEPVGWGKSSLPFEGKWWYLATNVCPAKMKRRIYLGPPEPIEEPANG